MRHESHHKWWLYGILLVYGMARLIAPLVKNVCLHDSKSVELMRQDQDVFLCLGSNLGDRGSMLLRAGEMIVHDVGPIIQQSSIYETEPWGIEGVNLFLNQVIQVKSTLQPVELLGVLQGIERELGRKRDPRYGMRDTRYGIRDTRYASDDPPLTSHHLPLTSYLYRPIDIDILFYGEEILDTPELTIPHPLIPERRFVLVPLAEIAGELVHPKLEKSIIKLLEECGDSGKVNL